MKYQDILEQYVYSRRSPDTNGSNRYTFQNEKGDYLEIIVFNEQQEMHLILDNFPRQRKHFKTSVPMRNLHDFEADLRRMGIEVPKRNTDNLNVAQTRRGESVEGETFEPLFYPFMEWEQCIEAVRKMQERYGVDKVQLVLSTHWTTSGYWVEYEGTEFSPIGLIYDVKYVGDQITEFVGRLVTEHEYRKNPKHKPRFIT